MNNSRNRVLNAILRQYMPDDISNEELFLSDGFKAIVEDIVSGIGKSVGNGKFVINLADEGKCADSQ